ncbi:hypothetical protein D3C78_1078710 [compost metagenome]
MQIADLGVRQLGYHLADLRHQGGVHLRIQQHATRVPQQPPGPDRHQHGPHYAHQGIQPVGPPQHAPHQGDDGQHRGGRIRQHVKIGGTQVQILMAMVVGVSIMVVTLVMIVMMSVAVVMVMVVMMSMTVMMVMIILEQPGARQVHQQAEQGDADGLLIVDRAGIQQPGHRLEQHQTRHPHQQQGAAEASQHLYLPGTEAESVIPGEVAGGAIGHDGEAEGQGMGAHVPAIRQQRH